MPEPLDLLADLIARARAAGADAADAVLVSGTSLSVQRRLGKTEHVERSEGRDLGLRVFLGQRAAIVSVQHDGSRQLQGAGRARRGDGAGGARGPLRRPRRHRRAAGAGRARSGGPDRADHRSSWWRAPPRPRRRRWRCRASPIRKAPRPASAGPRRSWSPRPGLPAASARTSHSVSATALAGAGTAMQRDYDYHSTVHLADLDDPAAIGRSAGGAGDRPAQPDAAGHRQAAGASTIRASPAACSAISPGRSTAPRWRAAPRS